MKVTSRWRVVRANSFVLLLIGALAGFSSVTVLTQGPPPAAPAPAPQGRGGGGFVAYPQRAFDAEAAGRGKAIYGVNCVFCHGTDARGGDGGGPNLLRSQAVLDDQRGEKIGPIVTAGRGAMPPFKLTPAEVADLAEFLHSFPVSSRSGQPTIDILVGDPKAGEAFVGQRCAACHTVDTFRAFAAKLPDMKNLQQMWLMPGAAGRGGGPAIPAPPVSATVTLPSGEVVRGRVSRVDDFSVSVTQEDGTHRSFRTFGTGIKVELQDPLAGHKELLRVYTDRDIHNVTAYIASLR